MRENLKNISSFLLLFIFLFPTIVKFEHKHEYFVCRAESEQHLHILQEKCNICTFEFSVFSYVENVVHLENPKHVVCFFNHYKSSNYSSLPEQFFLLRAPPSCQI